MDGFKASPEKNRALAWRIEVIVIRVLPLPLQVKTL